MQLTHIKKICIMLIVVPILISYGFSSFSMYYTPDNYYAYIGYSTSIQNGLIIISMFLSYGACATLFSLTIFDRNIINKKRFVPYFFIIISMIFSLIFITNDTFLFLASPGMWVGRMSLMPVFACSIYFYSYQEFYWKFINKLLSLCVIVMAIFVTIFLLTKPEIYTNRIYALKWLHGFGVILRLCPFLFLMKSESVKMKYVAIIIIILDIIMIISLQTRLYVIDLAFYIYFMGVLFFKNRKKNQSENKYIFIRNISIITIIILSIFIILLFIINANGFSLGNSNIASSIQMFAARLFEDSRGGQLENFMSYFWDSFPFGVGYNTIGINSGGGASGIDNGYLNTMYMAGLPMVLFLIFFTIPPILKAWRLKLDLKDIAIVARATTWIIILTSSTTTTYTIEFVFFIICAGRCAGLVDAANKRSNMERIS